MHTSDYCEVGGCMKKIGLSFLIAGHLLCFSQINDVIQSQYRIKSLSIEDGLSHSKINFVWQDYQGIMWFASNDGLNKYNGYSIKIYKNISDDSTSLYSNMVKGLYEDSHRNLWIGSDRLQRYNRDLDNFETVDLMQGSGEHGTILAITGDKLDEIWIGTNEQGLFSYNTKTKEINHYTNNPENSNTLSNNQIKALLIDTEGYLWVEPL